MRLRKLLVIITMASAFSAGAQDLIYKRNNEIILSRIIELGTGEIKYLLYNSSDSIVRVIDKREVSRIKYENGKTEFVFDGFSNPEFYKDQRRNAFKMDFLSPMFGQTTFGYERSLKPGESAEINLGIIGLGANNYETGETFLTNSATFNGAFFRIGYKFIRSPDYYLRGMRYSHLLKGSYIKPELTIGRCTEVIETYNWFWNSTVSRYDISFGALTLNFGKQWVINNIFLIDSWAGVGYGFSDKTSNKAYTSLTNGSLLWNNHAFLGPFQNNPFSFACGLKIGFLFK